MAYAMVPITRVRTKATWKELGFSPKKEYPVWLHQGHGVVFNDSFQPTTIHRDQVRRARRGKDFFYKLVKREMK